MMKQTREERIKAAAQAELDAFVQENAALQNKLADLEASVKDAGEPAEVKK